MNSRGSAPPPPARQRRTRATSTSSSSASTSTTSSILSTSTPSHLVIQTPLHPSSSSIPFSWEETPGIPKLPSPKPQNSRPIPLPPPLRSAAAAGDKFDPFAVALAECSKDPLRDSDSDPWIGRGPAKGGRRPRVAERVGFGLTDLYGSCKSSVSVARSTVEISNSRAGAYRILNRRVG